MNGNRWHILRDIRNLIIDMDGVSYRGTSALPGVSDFLEFLSSSSIKSLLATNNSTLTPERFQERLASMGIEVDDIRSERIITSSIAAAQYLSAHYPPPRSVYCVGEEGLERALLEAGYTISADQARLLTQSVPETPSVAVS
jgi:4-nitrophenyl phosphatase